MNIFTTAINTPDEKFYIKTISSLSAFAIVNLTNTFNYTIINSDWTSSNGSFMNESITYYNYIFIYNQGDPDPIPTIFSALTPIFIITSGTTPPNETEVQWVNGATSDYNGNPNIQNPFSSVTYNIDYLTDTITNTIEITNIQETILASTINLFRVLKHLGQQIF
jgi:hypothetical protein